MNKQHDNDFWVFSLPISGGSLCCQLAFLCEIYEARKILNGGKLSGKKSYYPNLCLGGSGGSVSSYIGLAGGFTTDGIIRCAKNLDPRSFSKPWIPKQLSVIPNIAIAVFKGSVYNNGYGARPLFQRLFSEKSISEVEIWNSAFNEDKKSNQFFCNRYQKDSVINQCYFNEEQFLFDSLKLKYMNEDIDLIADVAIASASIPLVVPNQRINKELYADAGVALPSPLTVFANEIYRIVTNQNSNLRLVYFFPYQSDRLNLKKETVLEQDIDTINQILHFSMLKDRNTSLTILNRLSKCISHKYYPEMNTKKLSEVMRKLNEHKHYVIWIEPHGEPKISLTKFTPEDVIAKIEQTRNNYSIIAWYTDELKDN